MKDENIPCDMVERAEENMREWVELEEDEFVEEMHSPMERNLDLPAHSAVRDIELLREFHKCASDYLDDSDDYHERRTKERIDYLEWPIDDWEVPEDEIDEIIDLKTISHMFKKFEADYKEWKRVFEKYQVEELRFISETIRIKESDNSHDSLIMVDCFRVIKGDSNININDIIEIKDDGDGAEPNVVEKKIRKAIKRIDPVLAGLTLTNINEIRTNSEDCAEDEDGMYHNSGILNIKKEDTSVESTSIHEFGHALFYTIRLRNAVNSSSDFREEDQDGISGLLEIPEEHPTELKEFCNKVHDIWDDFNTTSIFNQDCLRNYQYTDLCEFTAVSFSYWVEEPEKVEDVQPEIKDIYDQYLTGLEYTNKESKDDLVEVNNPCAVQSHAKEK
jgi:hypothetical protein